MFTTTYFGTEGDDNLSETLPTGPQSVWVYGDAGDDDLFFSGSTEDGFLSIDLDGGEGSDTLTGYANADGSGGDGAENHATGGEGDDTITLSSVGHGQTANGANFASGGSGDDVIKLDVTHLGWLSPLRAINQAIGGNGDDRISAIIRIHAEPDPGEQDIRNIIRGGNGDDRLSATITGDAIDSVTSAHSELLGGAGDDRLSARGGDGNILNGGTGSDTLLGSAGADTLIGLGGDDYLRGRGGDDIFLFGAIRNGEQDRVVDFVIGEDKIDLSQIDARAGVSGNQDFTFGTREGTGRVWIEEASRGSSSVLHADNGARELVVVLQDGRDVGPDDYHASDFLL